jgi:RNA polymerase sigma-70 factor (ECF subfamily)
MAPDERQEGAEGSQREQRASCFRVGQTHWPRVKWNEQQFESAWDQFSGAVEGGEDAARDEYLRLACLAGVSGAVETLETEFIAPLAPILGKRTGDTEIAEEALQQLRHKLLVGERPRLASYRSTGHLRAWLQVVAIRLCQDIGRQRGVRWEREAPLAEHLMCNQVEPQARLEKQELDELFVSALREVIRELPERERYALRMHLLAGWNVSQIGEALSTHRATAARWIVAAKQRLNDRVRSLLRQRLDLSRDEMERLFTLLSTQFDFRLSQVFKTTAEFGGPLTDAQKE